MRRGLQRHQAWKKTQGRPEVRLLHSNALRIDVPPMRAHAHEGSHATVTVPPQQVSRLQPASRRLVGQLVDRARRGLPPPLCGAGPIARLLRF